MPSARRRLADENGILPTLPRHGFRLIHAEAMTVAEPAQRFRVARMVMRLNGAGLSTLILTAPGCRVIELSAEGERDLPAHVRQLSAGCRHDYATARLEGDGTDAYRIAPADLLAALAAAGARAG
ncbi:glycosyltransferase 61 family protein [Roseomonas fluvialis]|uniref:Glycosyltransferase 61 catalytic domain-containing protein n=1 Tax=Roseomonas fluvialis TaxID=1750527 RepID=A0ABN6P1F3_9PROT|nr:glycosyltransferase family 61 protein [Roseomonas fluvialis]BDG72504.1 hypothetical protein Rmf_24330 [Roseomonas fluvialis]